MQNLKSPGKSGSARLPRGMKLGNREPGRGARGYDALWNRKDILFIKTSQSVIFHLSYCSSVRHFCDARDADKLEEINKRI